MFGGGRVGLFGSVCCCAGCGLDRWFAGWRQPYQDHQTLRHLGLTMSVGGIVWRVWANRPVSRALCDD